MKFSIKLDDTAIEVYLNDKLYCRKVFVHELVARDVFKVLDNLGQEDLPAFETIIRHLM